MLLSLVHNGKITNIDVDCASWRSYCRTSNLILVYSSTLELQNKRSINFITTILNFQWLFFIWGNFFINSETLTQLRFMSNLEMWQNIRYNFILCIKLSKNGSIKLPRCLGYEWAPMRNVAFSMMKLESLEVMRFMKISTQIKNILGNFNSHGYTTFATSIDTIS